MFFTPVVRSHTVSSLRSLDRSFERFVNGALAGTARPGVNVAQDDKAWTLSLDVPGVAKEDLTIGIEGTVVRIETRQEARRQFKGAYELPQEIDAAASTAALENGVLTVTLAKKAPVSNVVTLAIR